METPGTITGEASPGADMKNLMAGMITGAVYHHGDLQLSVPTWRACPVPVRLPFVWCKKVTIVRGSASPVSSRSRPMKIRLGITCRCRP